MNLSKLILLVLATNFDFVSADPDQPQVQIINGEDAPKGRFPYIVSLGKFGNQHICGGTLIAPDIVLTACHCEEFDSLLVGQTLKNEEVFEHTITDWLTESFCHPKWNKATFSHDQRLIKLSIKSEFMPVKVDLDHVDSEKEEEVTVMGWGFFDNSQTVSNNLKYADIHFIKQQDCKNKYKVINDVENNMICAHDAVRKRDACQGDSGGPLVRKGEDAKGADDVMVGITSWGYLCGLPNYPGVYSRTSALTKGKSWIRETVCEKSSSPPRHFNCECKDISTWKYDPKNGKKEKGCKFINSRNEVQRQKKCDTWVGIDGFRASEACPVTCDQCPDEEETCIENTAWKLIDDQGEKQGCSFIQNQEDSVKGGLCEKIGYVKPVNAGDACRLVCAKCPIGIVGCEDNSNWRSKKRTCAKIQTSPRKKKKKKMCQLTRTYTTICY
mmetsp:Transcript_50229/g.58631  ORF Transcript_50229/g.58631 Transcript_50229/m.58631 type:complete len:441 (+) Transcript_50229:158-1480(+)